MKNHEGVVAVLLFLRFGFAMFGVFGLLVSFPLLASGLSAILVFRAGNASPLRADEPALGTARLSFRPVDDRWNSPGLPVMGFWSMYSPPYRSCMRIPSMTSRISMSESVDLEAEAPFPWLSGMGVDGLPSNSRCFAPVVCAGVGYVRPVAGDQFCTESAAGSIFAMEVEILAW